MKAILRMHTGEGGGGEGTERVVDIFRAPVPAHPRMAREEGCEGRKTKAGPQQPCLQPCALPNSHDKLWCMTSLPAPH